MVNHPNRNANTIDNLRKYLVPVLSKFKCAEFSKIDKFNGERVILEASWERRVISVTVTTGAYGPTQITEGEAESFEIYYLFTKETDIKQQLVFDVSDSQNYNFDQMYQKYVLKEALRAQQILDNVNSDEKISDQVKDRVRNILRPYVSEYEHS